MPEILIYADIGESFWSEGVTAASVKQQLDEIGSGDVTVRINSMGGDVFDGFAIYNLLASHAGAVSVVIDGIAASAASVVAMGGQTIEMPENSMMMIHNPWTMALGDAAEMLKTAEVLDKIKDSIIVTYTTQTGMDEDTISDMMNAETWMGADEALEHGFATAKTARGQAASVQNLCKPWIHNAPTIAPTEHPQDQTNWQIALRRRRLELL